MRNPALVALADETNYIEMYLFSIDETCPIIIWRVMKACKAKTCGFGLLVFFAINSTFFPLLGGEMIGHKSHHNVTGKK